MSATRLTFHLNAPPAAVYRVLLDPGAIEKWKVPEGMACHVRGFDGREGGTFRITLTYDSPDDLGKSTAHADTYHGRFVKLVENEEVVEVDEFETEDPRFKGEMTVSIKLSEAGDGTDLQACHDGLPPGLSPADNELGWREALSKLAALVEQGGDRWAS